MAKLIIEIKINESKIIRHKYLYISNLTFKSDVCDIFQTKISITHKHS